MLTETPSKRVFYFKTTTTPLPPNQLLAFERTPLITPERLLSDWRKVFAPVVQPPWTRMVLPLFINPDDDEDHSFPDAVIFVVGGKHSRQITTSTAAFAVLCEIMRLGHKIVTNSNGKNNVYAKVSFKGAPEDLMSIRRVIFGAKANEVTKPLWRENDYGPDNTYIEEHEHPEKDARAVTMGHVERLARERKAAGTLPKGFDIGAYLSNIITLFTIIDTLRDPLNVDLDGSFAAYMAKFRTI